MNACSIIIYGTDKHQIGKLALHFKMQLLLQILFKAELHE